MPLVADMSSTILSRPIDVSALRPDLRRRAEEHRPRRPDVVIVRDDLLGRARRETPGVMRLQGAWPTNGSMLNTPPTLRLVLRRARVPVAQAAGRPRGHGDAQPRKASKLYARIDGRGFYTQPGGEGRRSWMNVPFTLPMPALDKTFLAEAQGRRPREARGPPLGRRHARLHLQRDAGGGREALVGLHARVRSSGTAERHDALQDPDAQQHLAWRASSGCRATATKSRPRSADPDAILLRSADMHDMEIPTQRARGRARRRRHQQHSRSRS